MNPWLCPRGSVLIAPVRPDTPRVAWRRRGDHNDGLFGCIPWGEDGRADRCCAIWSGKAQSRGGRTHGISRLSGESTAASSFVRNFYRPAREQYVAGTGLQAGSAGDPPGRIPRSSGLRVGRRPANLPGSGPR